jgi:hypothetical protein
MRNRTTFVLLTIVALSASTAAAQSNNDVQSILLVRTGFRDGKPFTYHYVEVFQERGRWIYPDIGYIDFGETKQYREFFIGAGGTVFASKHFRFIEEGMIEQALGPASEHATYFVPWSFAPFNITPRLGGEIVYFPYLPLNKQGRIQHVLERAKVEYDFKHFKAGAGYGAYQFGDGPWQNKPFMTATLKAGKLGNFEFWLQRLPGNHAHLQVRYAKVFN